MQGSSVQQFNTVVFHFFTASADGFDGIFKNALSFTDSGACKYRSKSIYTQMFVDHRDLCYPHFQNPHFLSPKLYENIKTKPIETD